MALIVGPWSPPGDSQELLGQLPRDLTHFGRRHAPLLRSASLYPDEQAFILMGLMPNRKRQPLLVEWQIGARRGGGDFSLERFYSFLTRTGLQAGGLPNRGHTPGLADTTTSVRQTVPKAAQPMHAHTIRQQAVLSSHLNGQPEGS